MILALFPIITFIILYSSYLLQALRELAILCIVHPNNLLETRIPRHSLDAPVAILYTICDDFHPESLRSLTNIDYCNKTIFILDDSKTDALSSHEEVLDLSVKHDIEYLRRGNRRGFKAGNINYGLSRLPKRYEYVFFADSDQRAPRACLRQGIALLEENRHYAFVQWSHRPIVPDDGDLPQHIADAYGTRSQRELSLRAYMDTVPSIGHGTLIRRSTLTKTDGLPEVISEDFAWTLVVRSQGQRGALLYLQGFEEDFPRSFSSFAVRFMRWCRADFEVALAYLPAIIDSKQINILSKCDLIVRQIRYPLASFAIPFAFLVLLLSYSQETGIISEIIPYLSFSSAFAFVLPFATASQHKGKNVPELLKLLIDGTSLCYGQVLVTFFGQLFRLCLRKKASFSVTDSRETAFIVDNYRWFHAAIAMLFLCSNFLDFHPLTVFLGVMALSFICHTEWSWHHVCCKACRAISFAWLMIWLVMGLTNAGVWQTEMLWLVVAASLLF